MESIFQSTLPQRERLVSLAEVGGGASISIHAPTKGATVSVCGSTSTLLISIHAPTKGATLITIQHKKQNKFQSTLPRRERQIHLEKHGMNILFQSTLPRRERRGNNESCRRIWYFNPRSHEGSDRSSRWIDYGYGISIHAPTKGATCLYKVRLQLDQISIHAPAKGATIQITICSNIIPISIHAPAKGATQTMYFQAVHLDFNPRSREGSDDGEIRNYDDDPEISIHAPAKGATETAQVLSLRTEYFNPRSREGSDSNISQNNKFIL